MSREVAKRVPCLLLVLVLGSSAHALDFTETQITTDPANQILPTVSGDRIVWADSRHGGQPDIYMYNVATGIETRITDARSIRQIHPAISGGTIVWVEGAQGFAELELVGSE